MHCVMKIRYFLTSIILFATLAPSSAFANDIPLLTWERGREQEVVLGGGATSVEWQVQLEGQNTQPLVFRRSTPNESGYVVYVVSLPRDLPTGAYLVTTEAVGAQKTTVASVNVIESAFFSITNVPRDLILVLGLFSFLVTSMSVLRTKRYSQLPPLPTFEQVGSGSGFFARMVSARLRLIATVRESIFKYFLRSDLEFLRRSDSRLPTISLVLSFAALGVTVWQLEQRGAVSSTPVLIFAILTLIGLFDLFSVTFVSGLFWLSQVLLGNVTSFRDAWIVLSICLSWILPGLLRNIYAFALRGSKFNEMNRNSNQLSLLFIPALIATVAFHLGNKLVDSVTVFVTSSRDISWAALVVVALASILRFLAESRVMKEPWTSDVLASFSIARTVSPLTALAISTLLFGYGFMWTENGERSLLLASLFSLPFFLLTIRLNEVLVPKLAGVRRGILVESIFVALVTVALYLPVRDLPLLGDEKSNLFMLLAAIPLLLHSVFSALADYAERVRDEVAA